MADSLARTIESGDAAGMSQRGASSDREVGAVTPGNLIETRAAQVGASQLVAYDQDLMDRCKGGPSKNSPGKGTPPKQPMTTEDFLASKETQMDTSETPKSRRTNPKNRRSRKEAPAASSEEETTIFGEPMTRRGRHPLAPARKETKAPARSEANFPALELTAPQNTGPRQEDERGEVLPISAQDFKIHLRKYSDYYDGQEFLKAPDTPNLEARTVALVTYSLVLRQKVALTKPKLEAALVSKGFRGIAFHRLSFTMWKVLFDTEATAKAVAADNILTKELKLLPEYMGKKKTRITVHNVPFEIPSEQIGAFFSMYCDVEEFKHVNG